MPYTDNPATQLRNPYKPNTLIWSVFEILSNGATHSIHEVARRLYSWPTPEKRRALGSTIRTLRRRFNVLYEDHGQAGRGYRLRGAINES